MKIRWCLTVISVMMFVVVGIGFAGEPQRNKIENDQFGVNVVAYWWQEAAGSGGANEGTLKITGMVENTTEQVIFVVLWVRLYGVDGQELTVTNTFEQVDDQRIGLWEQHLPPDGKGYFMHTLALSAISHDVARVEIEVEDVMDIETTAQAALLDVDVQHTETGTTISGTFTNTGKEICYNPVVLTVAYQGETILYVDQYFLPEQMELAWGALVYFEYTLPLPEQQSLESLGATTVIVVSACGAAG